ncbi:gliding motility-associated C-terminal domain-containing protein [Maribacter sp. 2307ULW6-5]|uniref:gliding motility-associated C-terminal domain-containing protein n=1 Tax=Maribacter sp. 2307ULW6-5 TaxID=3386275 RepID=UPI0039BC8378
MKNNILFVLATSLGCLVHGQTALYNNGNIRIHETGSLGFHTNLINDSPFDNNLGLAGFYGTDLSVSGTVVPLFHDVELALENALQLQLGVDVQNNTNFVFGNVDTDRAQPNLYYTFAQNAGYNGEGNLNKVNGYAAMANKANFLFPIGSAVQLRPLGLNSAQAQPFAKAAYFPEDPNAPVSIAASYGTERFSRELGGVSNTEFWKLEAPLPATVSLSWNPQSNMAQLTSDSNLIVVVGWNVANNRWENLGGTGHGGSLEEGVVRSNSFVPNDYAALALGVNRDALEPLESDLFELDNFYVSPNGDGINDALVIPQLTQSPNNLVQIFDRYGLKVFEMANYRNEFTGTANTGDLVLSPQDGLPAGIYFYLVKMHDLNLDYQGFIYLANP